MSSAFYLSSMHCSRYRQELVNWQKVKQQANKLGMAAPETTGVIDLGKDVVATDESGALSLSKSVAIAAGSEA